MKKMKLKPCPFCGGNGELRIKSGSWNQIIGAYVMCCKCGASMDVFDKRRSDSSMETKIRNYSVSYDL